MLETELYHLFLKNRTTLNFKSLPESFLILFIPSMYHIIYYYPGYLFIFRPFRFFLTITPHTPNVKIITCRVTHWAFIHKTVEIYVKRVICIIYQNYISR